MTTAPDSARAAEKYARLAATYDRQLGPQRLSRGTRELALERLELARGERVLDVACGTGVNFAPIVDAIGTNGVLVGVDVSSDMLDVARRRVGEHGWANVELVHAPVETAELSGPFDAALISFVHDLVRTPAALENVVAHLRPGGRLVAAGPSYPSRGRLLRPMIRRSISQYVTTFDGLERPWSHLERLLEPLEVERTVLGMAYVVRGWKPTLAEPSSSE